MNSKERIKLVNQWVHPCAIEGLPYGLELEVYDLEGKNVTNTLTSDERKILMVYYAQHTLNFMYDLPVYIH